MLCIMKPSRPADDKRYDRQLRIWGGHGQAALESARVCLFSAGGYLETSLRVRM